MPEIRSEDHINRLLVGAAFFALAAAVLGWLTVTNLALPVLPWVTGVLFIFFTCAAAVCILVWSEVHDDAG